MAQEYLASLISLAGGEIVGRIKLQKIVYLLDQLGQDSGFHYSYHHYGPYSEELAEQIDIERFLTKSITEEYKSRANDGATYSVFKVDTLPDVDQLKKLNAKAAKKLIESLNSKTSTVLELAATIHWLRDVEELPDWSDELVVRKGAKTGGGRAEKAQDLLKEIGL